MYKNRGFSLLELLIVISIISIVGAIGTGFYVNYGKNIGIKSVSVAIASDLKYSQSKSMIGEGGFKWGLHFVNGTLDYYEIFSTPTDYNDGAKVVISKKYLSDNTSFSDVNIPTTKDIIFNKISGSTTTSNVIIVSASLSKTIDVSSIGNISIQ